MRQAEGSIFSDALVDAVCVTTNGWIDVDGEAEMPRGTSLIAAHNLPDLSYALGAAIAANGNVTQIMALTKVDQMKQATGNMFDTISDAMCITTNGFIKANGLAVMGKGCAKGIQRWIPDAPTLLGKGLAENGNNTQVFKDAWGGPAMVAFPVKGVSMQFSNRERHMVVRHMQDKFKFGDNVPGWALVADLGLIEQSAKQLVELADLHDWNNVVLPRPGCGAGELYWEDVEPVLEEILDDRFTVYHFK